MSYWIEKTNVRDRNDRNEGDFAVGKALWSPTQDGAGRRIYEAMKRVQVGDIVYHLTDGKGFTGVSVVEESCQTIQGNDFPVAANRDWAGSENYFLVRLENYEAIEPPFLKEKFFNEQRTADGLRNFPTDEVVGGVFFTNNMRVRQGGYLTEAPQGLMEILNSRYNELRGEDLPKFRRNDDNPEQDDQLRGNPLDQLVNDVNYDFENGRNKIELLVDLIREKKSVILYGPPGTGKTFIATKLADHLSKGDNTRRRMIQFHQSYSYEEFIEGFRPSLQTNNSLAFSLIPGSFKAFCEEARKDSDEDYIFIIDEFNRGNIAKIFGELMYLLEYRNRDESIVLAYSGENFSIPENVFIIGTMNTADRSLAIMDFALRRRFAFFRLDPDYEVLRRFLTKNNNEHLSDLLVEKLRRVNRRIREKDFCLGISYFMKNDLNEDSAKRIWKYQIEPYLFELFHDEPRIPDEVRWEMPNNDV